MDNVNHPEHYTKASVVMEPITVCETLPFCQGNAFKYVVRAMYKGNYKEDLQKALWYLNHCSNKSNYFGSDAEVLLKFYTLNSGNPILENAMSRTIKACNGDMISCYFWDELKTEIEATLGNLKDEGD